MSSPPAGGQGYGASAPHTGPRLLIRNGVIPSGGMPGILQKPVLLTTFGRSDCLSYIYLYIKVLTPATYDQYFPAKGGLDHRLFQ
jgi:hypothetical protein